MGLNQDEKNDPQQDAADKEKRDSKRIETNKTDPQITELKGFVSPEEPIEEEGTINPFTGNRRDPE